MNRYWRINPEKRECRETFRVWFTEAEIADYICVDYCNLYLTLLKCGCLYHAAETRDPSSFVIENRKFKGLSLFVGERPKIQWGKR